jgi:hypothetical protein
MKPPIVVGGINFRTKAELRKYAGDIRHRYKLGERIGPEDDDFLRSLLLRHPEYELLVGCGVEYFFTRINRQCSESLGFWFRRLDGSETDFSYLACVSPKPHGERVRQALRHAVSEQIWAFKLKEMDRFGTFMMCPVEGVMFRTRDAHVDHVTPYTFKVLVDRFLAEREIDTTDVGLAEHVDGQFNDGLLDDQLRSDWQDCHAKHAVLRLVSRKANCGTLRRKGAATT